MEGGPLPTKTLVGVWECVDYVSQTDMRAATEPLAALGSEHEDGSEFLVQGRRWRWRRLPLRASSDFGKDYRGVRLPPPDPALIERPDPEGFVLSVATFVFGFFAGAIFLLVLEALT